MKVRVAVGLLVCALVLPSVASAAQKVWDGGGADANWMTKENWVGDVAPVPSVDSLEFPETAARKSNSNNFPSGSMFLGIHFTGATGNYVLSGNTLLLGGPITSSVPNGTHTINFAITTSTDGAMSVSDPEGTLTVGQINLLTDLALSGAGKINITGVVNGAGAVTKTGSGVATLAVANTYTGDTTVFGGTLIVNGVQSGSAITMTGGILRGTGTVGAVGAYSGTVSPGASPGMLRVGGITMTQETIFRAELGCCTPGSGYDQLNVTGAVDLGGATLNATLGFAFVPSNLQQFTIINNDGADAVARTFAGLPQGSSVTVDGRPFTISYVGGTGNDVVLTAVAISYISGRVTNAATGAGVAAEITIYKTNGSFAASTSSNSNGVYTSNVLPTGSYVVRARPPSGSGLMSQLYNRLPCPADKCDLTTGAPVTVTAPDGTPNINFPLTSGGAITGTVTNAATSAPVANATIAVYSHTGVFLVSTGTNAAGLYTTNIALPAGSYFVTAQPLSSTGLFGQLYNNLPCPYASCTVTSGTPVAVTAANATTVNFALPTGGTITGTVTNATTFAPVANVRVRLFTNTGQTVNTVLTNAQGVYTLPALATSAYFLKALPQPDSRLAPQLYNSLPCPNESCALTGGTPVAVTAPNATTLNVALTPGGTITGTVTNAATSQPVANVWIYFFTSTGNFTTIAVTNAQGFYSSPTLPDGSYFVRATPFEPTGLVPQLYQNISCPDAACPVLSGTAVAVAEPNATPNIDFALTEPPSPPRAFGKVSPGIRTPVRPAAVTLSWKTSALALSYEYCIDTSNNNTCDATWVPVGNATRVWLTGLALNTEYFWHVRAVNDIGTTYADEGPLAFWSFTGSLPMIDLNGDGHGDAFTHDPATGAWQKRFTQPDATFTTESSVWGPGWDVVPAVFEGPGKTKVFLFNTSTGQWQRRFNSPAGYQLGPSGSWWPGWQRHVLDLDGDGFSDIFLYDPATGAWFKAFSTPSGFTYEHGTWNPGWEIYPTRLDDDAFDDMFLINRTTGRWFWALSASGAGFSYPASGTWFPGWQLHPGDFNGDRLGDLFLYEPTAGEYYVAFNNGAGYAYASGSGWAAGWTPYVAELDADGRDDLYLHSEATGVWVQMISDGTGNFTNVGGQQGMPAWLFNISDFNGDGRADVLLYDPATGAWFQARNVANGTYTYTNGLWAPGLKVLTRGPNR